MSAEKKQEADVAPAQEEPALAAPKDQEMGALEIEQPKNEPKKSLTWKEWAVETFVDDKWFWLIIIILLLANIGIYRSAPLARWVGFILASYSAISNDSIQTLGTFIASNTGVIVWWK